MLTKQEVHDQLNGMPDSFSLDAFIERLIVVDKIQKGTNDLEEGNTLTEEELDSEIEKWFG